MGQWMKDVIVHLRMKWLSFFRVF